MSELTHADFARKVLALAAPPERVGELVESIVDHDFEVGPLRVGPGGIGRAAANGSRGAIEVLPCVEPGWDLLFAVPVHLDVRVDLAGRTARYSIEILVKTRIRLQVEAPCNVFVDIEPVRRGDVDAKVNAHDTPSRLLGWLGNINAAVADEVCAFINQMLVAPEVVTLRRIDVADVLGRAWDAGLVLDPSRARSIIQPDVYADAG